MLPDRKAAPYRADTRPRISTGATRTIRPIAEIVNMVDPMPPRPRTTSNCSYDWANAQAAVEPATISSPVM